MRRGLEQCSPRRCSQRFVVSWPCLVCIEFGFPYKSSFRSFNFRHKGSRTSDDGSSGESGVNSDGGTPTIPLHNPCRRRLDLRWVFQTFLPEYYSNFMFLAPPFRHIVTLVILQLVLVLVSIPPSSVEVVPIAVH